MRAVIALSTLIPLSSCEAEFKTESAQNVEVGFHIGSDMTRTTMLSDGISTKWEADDQLALWAKNSDGAFTLQNQIFKLHGADVSRGFFTSVLPAAMPDGNYTYFCCYPLPKAVNGSEVTFNIPSVQDGKVSGGSAVMLATPTQHHELTAFSKPDDHSTMKMEMNHMMHQFRFYVPEEDQILGNEKIERICLTFPKAVTGDVTLDLENPESKATLTNGKSDVTLELAQPIGVSNGNDYEFACLAFPPVKFEEGQALQITRAYIDDKIALFDPIDLKAKDCLAGHSTPVKLKIRELVDFPFKILFTVHANNLGEGINTIKFVAPSGCLWSSTGSNEYEYTPGHKINTGEVIAFYFDYDEESLYRAFSGQNITITYDSDHAITSQTVTIGDISNTDAANLALTVPYLFYENFASLVTYDGDYTGGPYTSTDGATTAARDLSQYGIPGWTGARTGCDAAGTAILVGGRVDCVIAGATRAYGRLDSPPMSSLKGSANIKVTFNYSGSRSGNTTYYPVGVCGTTVSSGLLNGYATQFNNNESWSGVSDLVSIPDIPTSGSATATNKTMECTFNDCTPNTRLTWHVVGMGYKSLKINNGTDWMYLDNVRVQIAN